MLEISIFRFYLSALRLINAYPHKFINNEESAMTYRCNPDHQINSQKCVCVDLYSSLIVESGEWKTDDHSIKRAGYHVCTRMCVCMKWESEGVCVCVCE